MRASHLPSRQESAKKSRAPPRGPDTQGAEHRPVRALDPMELKRIDPLRLLIQAYCFFSSGGAACEAAAAPAGVFVSGSVRNLPTICGTSAEVMKL
jgi:hypothetical protein